MRHGTNTINLSVMFCRILGKVLLHWKYYLEPKKIKALNGNWIKGTIKKFIHFLNTENWV